MINWLTGDFNGDGFSDLLAIWNDSGKNTLTVRLSSRSAFAPGQHWLARVGTYLPNAKWIAGDFDGDGKTDVASVTPGGGAVFTIFRSTSTSFIRGTPSAPDGGWGDEIKFIGGDFDADGKTDIAAVWNNGGHNDIVMRRSSGSSFLPGVSWMRPGVDYGGWMDTTAWIAGTFRR